MDSLINSCWLLRELYVYDALAVYGYSFRVTGGFLCFELHTAVVYLQLKTGHFSRVSGWQQHGRMGGSGISMQVCCWPCSDGYFHVINSALSFADSNITEVQPDAASFLFFAHFLTFESGSPSLCLSVYLACTTTLKHLFFDSKSLFLKKISFMWHLLMKNILLHRESRVCMFKCVQIWSQELPLSFRCSSSTSSVPYASPLISTYCNCSIHVWLFVWHKETDGDKKKKVS